VELPPVEDDLMADHLGGDVTAGVLAVPDDYVPRKRTDVLELDMGDGVVLYDPASSFVHHLNPSASVLWHLADGDASVARLATEMSEELRLDPIETRAQLVGLVAELDALGLVEDGRLSRRGSDPDG
jgi:PqqD family protein of HPr-rel-A system